MSQPWELAKAPCSTCPYLCDTPSGMWARSEYEKLPGYDRDALAQGRLELAPFACHQTSTRPDDAPTLVCRGWLAVSPDSIAARMAVIDGKLSIEQVTEAADSWEEGVLYASGQEAYEAGIEDLADPSPEARQKAERLIRRGRGAIRREGDSSRRKAVSDTSDDPEGGTDR